MDLALTSLVIATAIGILVRLRDGRFRAVHDQPEHPLAALALGRTATFVQFSSQTCSVCPRSLAVLGGVAQARSGVEVVEVSAEERMDLVRLLDVRRSPTVFLLDADGAVHARTSGAMNAELAGAALDALLERTTRVTS
jgi:hypothetical protein